MRPRISDFHGARWFSPRRAELDASNVQPHTPAGVGLPTGHPAGLVVILGVFLLVIEYVPAARWFFAASLALGGILGLILWHRHR